MLKNEDFDVVSINSIESILKWIYVKMIVGTTRITPL